MKGGSVRLVASAGVPGERPDQLAAPPLSAVAVSSVAVKHRSPLPPILAAAVGAVVVIAAVVLVARHEGGDGPATVVRAYFAALDSADCERVVQLVDTDGAPGEPDRDRMVSACREAYRSDPATIERVELAEARLVSLQGDRATVRAEFAGAGEDQPSDEIPLVHIDGEWKLDPSGFGADADAAGADPAP